MLKYRKYIFTELFLKIINKKCKEQFKKQSPYKLWALNWSIKNPRLKKEVKSQDQELCCSILNLIFLTLYPRSLCVIMLFDIYIYIYIYIYMYGDNIKWEWIYFTISAQPHLFCIYMQLTCKEFCTIRKCSNLPIKLQCHVTSFRGFIFDYNTS
jgi:hypothetical protein